MRLIRAGLGLLLLLLSAAAFAVPGVLVFRLKPGKGVLPLSLPICDALANEIQAGGKLTPVVWGITDPIYRSAVESGKIRSGEDTPTLSEAQDVAHKLLCPYVLAVDIRAGEGELLSAAYLYKGGSLVWKDPDTDLKPVLDHMREMLRKKQITQAQYDSQVLHATYRASAVQIGDSKFGPDDTARAIARSWSEMINTGPLVRLVAQHVKTTPDPGRGEVVPNTGGTQKTTPPADMGWNAAAGAALKAGDTIKAVNILRDAIDASPMDVPRRLMLVKALMQMGKPEVAAQEARRAAELMPDHIEFRAMAARGWIQAGNSEEAQADLNEAVTRAPDSPETRMLLANVALAKGEYPAAIEHLDKTIKTSPTGDAYYLRALAHAMAGDVDLGNADLKKATDAGLNQDPQEAETRYGLVAAILDAGITTIGADIRTLQQKALVQRTDKDVKATSENLIKEVTGRTGFISTLPVPPGHETSHNRRVLAYKLLSQCLSDLGSYMKSGDQDVLTDSRINLGEALKQGVSAREKFKDEQQGARKGNAGSG